MSASSVPGTGGGVGHLLQFRRVGGFGLLAKFAGTSAKSGLLLHTGSVTHLEKHKTYPEGDRILRYLKPGAD